MGPRPKHVTSELAKTLADAEAVAAVELAKVLMVTDSVEAEVPAHAKLEMGQYARLVSDALGVDAVYRLNRVVHDLGGGPAKVTLYRFSGV
jgi:prophage tail gpP-like protein